MSAKKVNETNTLMFEDENTDSGVLSGPLSEQLYSEDLSAEADAPTSPISPDSDNKVISESTQFDSGLDLCLSECLVNVSLNDPPQTTVPLIQLEAAESRDVLPLSILFQQDDDGDTQLHIAAVHGCEKSVGTLINVCPDKAWLDVPNDYGHTPLHLAAMSGQATVTRMLVIAGASIATRDLTGDTPLHKAVSGNYPECLRGLLTPVTDRPTRKLSTIINQKNYKGQTCVHLAASAGRVELLQMLVFYGADINARDGLAGWTALHVAARRGDVRVAQFLLERCSGVARDARDFAGRTPRRLARTTRAAQLFADVKDSDDSDTDDEYDSDSDTETLYEKIRQSINPINVA
ncbi:NF-kappa-B inhibitor cactus-like [Pararge aegeria]|uniref:Jg8017 protein n=2 Tax=Pararge aegeria TaxID=116150 RepID=A0A8S4RHE1_9NEOP|nr:NF-kappa-B inhibitor cactus-like [Pararge aegeria]CAH2236535.1 jg8017 [Pararge aegeria aegeria]